MKTATFAGNLNDFAKSVWAILWEDGMNPKWTSVFRELAVEIELNEKSQDLFNGAFPKALALVRHPSEV